jgi:UDP-glucuronate 4-epimerase
MSQGALVTGAAGFIGFHLSLRLLKEGYTVLGFDNFNAYYSPELKRARARILCENPKFRMVEGDLADAVVVEKIFRESTPTLVAHLGAQAGVRHSLTQPRTYMSSNLDGTLNVLEAARHLAPQAHLMLASSSSVYGLSTRMPFREDDPADRPVALYGATKRANELMAHSYSHLFGLRTTLLRFFTVYGPWGRPDMALFGFVEKILKGEKLPINNKGEMSRDFTYVDDVVESIVRLQTTRRNPEEPSYDVYNVGGGRPRKLLDFVRAIETATEKTARMDPQPFQPGDIQDTIADPSKLQKATGFTPEVQLETGIPAFVRWYREYHGV